MRSSAERTPSCNGRAALALIGVALVLAGCASSPKGGSFGRDGAPATPPSNLGAVPDAEPRVEPIRGSGGTSKPYTVLGRAYVPITDDRPFRESGLASWYGTKFHSQSTASGEPYDMYAMTAAHKTLPLPSYVRVRNPANGREVIVRVNDRGPFHDGRVIDLSYTAALKLDLLRGVAPVEIERLTNEDIRTGAWRRGGDTMLAAAPAVGTAVSVPSGWTANVAATPIEAAASEASAQAVVSAAPPPPAPLVVTELPPMAPIASVPAAASMASTATQTVDAPASVAPAGFWVQLGAFRERDGAESLRTRASRGLPTLAPLLRVFTDAETHRLQAGPFATREAASATVAQVRDELRMAAIVVERR
ncbi:septal ring lytic transglycosylase RlpA family protein [Variovorax arabinosiphilus]|uniref:septal ring lytic transglycosylase RlpA family protein n=1 Tax=Variovorax arabinosiphilus TaxID=3053498 RepID=UPI0025787854|nr:MULTISPECIES: septal ring lytic transglycosylase RlpA family protein [unclassified Variovorax]MDM0121828.1 septal ring lytic transglycosylase RlpA family protein [Variovorax sp. J2L1-78]MDM0131642.1 septal ring lytic transglycosylase RlpA family protein [Variovorax sp. J2L1-63]MDM0234591.1 septal ring lytic transglycosylase RlpA family protein [Variovorax sp. J2R1-6]